jgi:CHAT domain-containing protein
LPGAVAERDYVLSLADSHRYVTQIPATFTDVVKAFSDGVYDAWHFSGHGIDEQQDPDRSAILLEGRERYTPIDLSGRSLNLGIPHPLVFLNACQTGRGGFSLTGMGGWASAFVNAGAAGFIGTYWSVADTPALNFARELYGRLLSDDRPPIGQAVKEARETISASGDPTWLAYTVFADPLATVTKDD